MTERTTTDGGLGLEENRLINETRWWPVDYQPPRFALYVCGGCWREWRVEPSFTFTRVPHFCRNGDSARMVT